jgi:hypothetical protein
LDGDLSSASPQDRRVVPRAVFFEQQNKLVGNAVRVGNFKANVGFGNFEHAALLGRKRIGLPNPRIYALAASERPLD